MDQDKMDISFYISTLVAKMLKGELSVEEKNSLDAWVASHPDNAALLQQLADKAWLNEQANSLQSFNTETALEQLNSRIQLQSAGTSAVRRLRFYWAAAASVLVVITMVAFYFYNENKSSAGKSLASGKTTGSVATPGKVLLTLADGTVVDLQAANNGEIGRQGETVISKAGDNMLDYSTHAATATGDSAAKLAMNVLTIPGGMKYQVLLPDGTHVWLNAQTTLKYPAVFASAERMVELEGEAYFEVAERANQPFKVKTKTQQVQVLGTEFNISAYANDPVTATTLIGGAVRVSGSASSLILRPGQKAALTNANGKMAVAAVDIEEVLSWKNGYLNFNDERIEDIMRQVARVYNVEIEFKGNVKDRRFWGRFPVDKGLMNLLRNLEQTKTIRFRLEGKKLLVME